MKNTIALFVAACLVSGCATTGLGGSTTAETRLRQSDPPTIDPVTGQVVAGGSIDYERNLKLKAGDTLEGSDNMVYEVAPNETWRIAVGQAGSADTTFRAQSITDVTGLYTAIIPGIVEVAINAALQAYGISASNRAADDARDDSRRGAALDLLPGLIDHARTSEDNGRALLREWMMQNPSNREVVEDLATEANR